ncbi:DNA polymerase Y family protein [Chitinophaga agrisoli]|uniref:DNA polymerase Y family protein n=1 Tax=Chitinophaga agrisoli TaxID=2607653 RepID=A0A5B2VK38_9BACT|nr:DNA polymerase Y family protein [Chitinophaga agrisoli]KAA2239038.1 DNA polymerase Y family protein [Chitinophaga agrisoli]
MPARFVSIWFRHLLTDWLTIRRPDLQGQAFVLAAPDHGRLVITAASKAVLSQGISEGMVVADARALIPQLQVFNDRPGLAEQLLQALCKWCIRYTPIAAVDKPDGLVLDASGCAHLWGGEKPYLEAIVAQLNAFGYDVRVAMADTVGAAWAVARFGNGGQGIIPSGQQTDALLPLPPAALRLEPDTLERLQKLGLYQVSSFITMPRSVLRRRFGAALLLRVDQASGWEEEVIQPLLPPLPFQERLPCLEPILTRTGIEIALKRLLDTLCDQLQQKGKGLRSAVFKGYRVDGKLEQVEIGTHRATHNVQHLFKLFEDKIPTIRPALGIELFILEAPKVEDLAPLQESLWSGGCSLESIGLAALVDRITSKLGEQVIHRYLPEQCYWPERSFKQTDSLLEKATTEWRNDIPRPVRLLPEPEPVTVSAPIPDYPPMLFTYKGQIHYIKRADGPERIAREWWVEAGPHRDYYTVEDQEGRRYWLFRSGHYDADNPPCWFIHGFFA